MEMYHSWTTLRIRNSLRQFHRGIVCSCGFGGCHNTRSLIKRKIVCVKCSGKRVGGENKCLVCATLARSLPVQDELLTTVLKKGCLRHSRTLIRFSGSTTRHLRIKSLGSSKSTKRDVLEKLLRKRLGTHRKCPTIQGTWSCTFPPWCFAALSFACDARTADSRPGGWTWWHHRPSWKAAMSVRVSP